jgi:hypothetical protein
MRKPAEVVIALFGVRPLARMLDVTPGAVAHWRDTGLVPSKYHERLMSLAKQRRLKLTTDMLVYGA